MLLETTLDRGLDRDVGGGVDDAVLIELISMPLSSGTSVCGFWGSVPTTRRGWRAWNAHVSSVLPCVALEREAIDRSGRQRLIRGQADATVRLGP